MDKLKNDFTAATDKLRDLKALEFTEVLSILAYPSRLEAQVDALRAELDRRNKEINRLDGQINRLVRSLINELSGNGVE